MSELRAAIERVCARLGIATGYHDIWGHWQVVPDSSLTALLAESGVDASSSEAIANADAALNAARARELVPPVVLVAPDSAPWHIAIQAAALPGGVLTWQVETEAGDTLDGRLETGGAGIHGEAPMPAGYHRLTIRRDNADSPIAEALVIAAPDRCWRPAALEDGTRVWGPAVQLYALRSSRNWGIGDFSDLLSLAERCAEAGAAAIGVNPLHALFPHNPAHISPYSPSSRSMLNVLYVDVEAVPDFAESDEVQRLVRDPSVQARIGALRATDTVDYPGVAAIKFEVLARLYAHFRTRHLAATRPGRRAAAFRAFQETGGEALRRHALFETLQEHFHRADPQVWGWQVWPEAYRDPDGAAVRRFLDAQLERVEFFEYLQWQASLQLGRVAARCDALGMAIGLYLDLAVSVDRAGSDGWSWRDCYAIGASIGAPPDDFNMSGQDWGLPPLRPERLRHHGYAPIVGALRACMREAGALRIDHVLGLMRLYWIPPGRTAREGAYVHYALDELMAIVALESHRNRCMVIGEDLGTVADEVRQAMLRYGMLSYRVLFFERDGSGEFLPPDALAREALITVSTHDLPTLAGWWEGRDIRLRQELNLFPDDGIRNAQAMLRAQDRVRLLLALERRGLLPTGVSADALPPALGAELIEAVHAYAAAAPSRLMMVQLEDILGLTEQANLPATVEQHPNWRRKLPVDLAALFSDPRAASMLARLARERPHPARTGRPDQPLARTPLATYRLQLNRDFTFADATRLLPYLDALGVSDVYCSPILRARAGSTHGYDIVDHHAISPELGGEAGFYEFSDAVHARGMGILLDIVPNHMGVLGADNAWWMDVLENGPASMYAHYFDIEWNPVNPDLQGKVMAPVLGDQYGIVLARGELQLEFEADTGAFALRYYDHRFPIDPREYPRLLRRAEADMPPDADAAARVEFSSLAAAFGHLPPRSADDPVSRAERARDKEVHKRRLAQLAHEHAAIAQALAAAVAAFNADAQGELHALLDAQAYRLAFWRVASDEINYRRFFDINDLAALRMEDPEVFEATHALPLSLAAEGRIDGLRIDHPDGLFDPAQYFDRLQRRYAELAGIELGPTGGDRPARPLYVALEKITARHEHVPERWAVHGTTGYRFGVVVNGLFVDTGARTRLDRIWRAFTGLELDFEEAAYRGKHVIMRSALASELAVLATDLLRIARADPRTRDYTFNTLRRALAEVAACMPVYRTYIVRRPSAQDRRYIDWAVSHATRRSRAADTTIFGFVRQALLGQALEGTGRKLAKRVRRFAMKFQQFTAPVTAKGEEDTAFYIYNRLTSLNEVGGDPSMFGFSVRAFHGASADRAARWPYTMLATSTHDNKRAEDVRCRIDVISEMPAAWRLLLRRWNDLNRRRRRSVDGRPAPAPNDEYLLYQTLLGTWPGSGLEGDALDAYRIRIERYLLKGVREAKVNSSWINPDIAYEDALCAFVRELLARGTQHPFLDDLTQQAQWVEWFGALNSLSMALVKFTSPGVPDLYQGCETIDLSLVDPDNRRPIDYAPRQRLVNELQSLHGEALADAAQGLATTLPDGRAKLFTTWRLLHLRRRLPALLQQGSYCGLAVKGDRAGHLVAFAREQGRHLLVAVATRMHVGLLGRHGALPVGGTVWGDTQIATPELPEGTRLVDHLLGGTVEVRNGAIRVADALVRFPGAVLLCERH